MKIQKHTVLTRDNVQVNTVIIYFKNFKPVQLSLNESSYFGIMKPLVNEIFGMNYIPIFYPTVETSDLKKSLEVRHDHLGFPRVLSWLQKKNLL